jgi:hypothetical protein
MAVLFAQEGQEELDLTRENWTANEPEKSPDVNGELLAEQQAAGEPGKPVAQIPTSRETLISFSEQLASFLDELAATSFAEECDAPRMVQALAFPLLLCLRGADAGWLPASQLGSVATQVARIMIENHYEAVKARGLLRVVRERHTAAGRLKEFHSAVGDGTLWTLLVAALVPASSTALRVLLPQATALANILQCQDLLTNADAPQLSSLAQSVLIRNAEENITEKAGAIAQTASSLTGLLSKRWDALYRAQGSGRPLQPAQSISWSRSWGWKITISQIYCPGYVNVDSAAAAHAEVREAIRHLIQACDSRPAKSAFAASEKECASGY